jgi:hypothetical protein
MQSEHLKYRILILLNILLMPFTANTQERELAVYDSITYQQYLRGDWDELIITGQKAIEENVDFKWLRQRMGYAYLMKKQYYQSYDAYEAAYRMDHSDTISKLYLYYNSVYTGNYNRARYLAGKLPEETRNYFKQKAYRPVDAVDLEFSYKIPEYAMRENADYKRIGINSQLGYQLNLYQTLSDFRQTTDITTQSKQYDYYANISWRPLLNSIFSAGYHYTGTRIIIDPDTFNYTGHLLSFRATQQISRFDISASVLNYNSDLLNSFQVGIHAGTGFAGNNNIYLKSSLYRIWQYWYATDYNIARYVYTQSAGIMLFGRLWAEASVALGNLDHFADLGGMYLYNTLDPVTFRTGLSLYGYITPRLTVYSNYTLDRKYYTFFDVTENYLQHSITGGIIWKL